MMTTRALSFHHHRRFVQLDDGPGAGAGASDELDSVSASFISA
jgi:hypothetical protein